ncbi:hypothetical protein G195_002455 [Phytophthora kernoviae 00238/432]|uniref:Uncharacterized protein n=1 Tax=Phytophthora kernoviae 00238/432 TaxID=1284355 RepID=A0A8J4WMV6_9STRA|nr:hypothetical protein G195_002455 [Phytophthora kernoviae 00238/432]
MQSRWVDSIKRGITPSPRGERSPQPSGNTSAATPSSTLSSVSATSLNGAENPAYNHDSNRCDCVGACSVARVLENCVLQGGVHHTHMHVLTYLGRPLRSECCCYPVAVQWFRAVGEQDDFQVIPGACDEWYTPTADDIGARILAKVMIEDEDVLKTKMLEYGPIKADPEVRSKVEMYLERKSVLFMGLQSISVKDGSEYLNDEELRESWTLLIDDRRVRLTCESSLIPPFESLYTPDIKLEMVQGKPNEFFLHLAQDCYVRLRAESNTVRDIIVLTLRAFCKEAVSYETTQDAVARGQSPMLTLRKIAQEEETKRLPPVGASAKFGGLVGLSCMLRLYTPSLTFDQQAQETVTPPPGPVYDLPWNRAASNSFSLDLPESTGPSTALEEIDDSTDGGVKRLSLSSSVGGGIAGSEGWQQDDDLDDSLLLDAEALIGNAHKMGIQYQILPRAPKRISIADIPDLLIIEAIENLNVENAAGKRSRQGRAIEDFMAGKSDDLKTESVDVSALRERYVAIFCALQRELHTYKQRVVTLSKQLEENQEQNTSFRKDIESLRSALTSMQVTDKVYDLVTTDLQKLVQRTESVDTPSIPGLVSPST